MIVFVALGPFCTNVSTRDNTAQYSVGCTLFDRTGAFALRPRACVCVRACVRERVCVPKCARTYVNVRVCEQVHCVYNSTTRETPTEVGPTAKHEMCNFYFM